MRTSTAKKITYISQLIEKGRADWAEASAKKFGVTRQAIHSLVKRHIGTEHPTKHEVRPPLSKEARKAIRLIKAEFKKGTRNWVEVVALETGLTDSQVKSLAINYAKDHYTDHLENGTLRRHEKMVKYWNRGWSVDRIAAKLDMDEKDVFSRISALRKKVGADIVHPRHASHVVAA